MRSNFKLFLLLAVAILPVALQANTIRLHGPDGSAAQPSSNNSAVSSPSEANSSALYGPTTAQDTLWSIASKVRADSRYSVQQTLLAIYRLNPAAFEDQNIHKMIPGSRLRLPSVEQVAANSTQEAKTLLAVHQNKLNQPTTSSKPAVKPKPAKPKTTKPVTPTTASSEDKTTASGAATAQTPSTEDSAQPQDESKSSVSTETTSESTKPNDDDVEELEKKLELSESELLALEKKNLELRLMLAKVQNEVHNLHEELQDDSRIRDEVEKLLAQERDKQAEQQRMQPSTLDSLLSNIWLVIALALLPSLLLVYLIASLILRKSNKQESSISSESAQLAAMPLSDEVPEINLDDDGINDEELLLDMDMEGGDDLDALTSDAGEGQSLEEDPFAEFHDTSMEYDLTDENGYDPFSDIGDDGDFDLSDPAEATPEKGDELATGFDAMEQEISSLDAQADQDIDLASDEEAPSLPDSKEELDSIFEQTTSEDEFDLSDGEQSDDLGSSEVLLDELLEDNNPDADLTADSDLPEEIEEDNTQLLDEFLEAGDSDLGSELTADSDLPEEIEEDNTQLLDEFLEGGDSDLGSDLAADSDLPEEIEEDNTQLLDEFLEGGNSGLGSELTADSDLPEEIEEDSTQLLDEFLEGGDNDLESGLNTKTKPSGVAGAQLFDELLNDAKGNPDTDSSVESHSPEALDDEHAQLFDELLEEGDSNLDSVSNVDSTSSFDSASNVVNSDNVTPNTDSTFSEAEEAEHAQLFDELLEESDSTQPEQADTLKQKSQPELYDANQDNRVLLDDILGDDFGEQDIILPEEAEETIPPQSESSLVDEPAIDSAVEETEIKPTSNAEEVETEKVIAQVDEQTPSATDDIDAVPFDAPQPIMQSSLDLPENELGQPVDSDWLLDEPEDQAAVNESNLESELAPQEQTRTAPSNGAAKTNIADVAEQTVIADDDLPEYTEAQALADSEQEQAEMTSEQAVDSSAGAEKATDSWAGDDLGKFDEDSALEELLTPNDNTAPELSSDTIQNETAGLNFDTMFEADDVVDLSPNAVPDHDTVTIDTTNTEPSQGSQTNEKSSHDTNTQAHELDIDIPDEEKEVWSSQVDDVQIEDEDWSTQDDLGHSETKSERQFMSIDELMGKIDQEGGAESQLLEEEELNLDVGLNEFPDVIGEVEEVDVDQNSEAIGKLDLAKIYVEMNDVQGAIRLLDQAIELGDKQVKADAMELKASLNSMR